jgi:hypothetical protein
MIDGHGVTGLQMMLAERLFMQSEAIPTPDIPDGRLTCNVEWVLLSLPLNSRESLMLDSFADDEWMDAQPVFIFVVAPHCCAHSGVVSFGAACLGFAFSRLCSCKNYLSDCV